MSPAEGWRAARSCRAGKRLPRSGPGSTDLAAVGRGSRLGLIGAAFSAVANLALALIVTRGFGRHDAGLFFSATAVFLVLEMLSRLGTDTASVYFIARLRALGDSHLIAAHLRAALKPVLAVVGRVRGRAGVLRRLSQQGTARRQRHGRPAGDGRLPALRGRLRHLPGCHQRLRHGQSGDAAGEADPAQPAARLPGRRGGDRKHQAMLADRLGRCRTSWSCRWRSSCSGPAGPAREHQQQRRPGAAASPENSGVSPRHAASPGLAQALLQRLDIIIVAAMLGPSEAAVYAAATRFLVLGQLGNQAISAPVEPRLSALLARRDIARGPATSTACRPRG